MKTVVCKIKSVVPMLTITKVLLDPTHPLTQQHRKIGQKRGKDKTEKDLLELKWIEFQANLCWEGSNGSGRVCVDCDTVEAVIREGGKQFKNGLKVQAGVMTQDDKIPLIYPKQKQSIAKLYADHSHVDYQPVKRPGGIMVPYCRPKFNSWELEFTLVINDSIITVDQLKRAIEKGGLLKGIGSFRPRYGRFELTEFQEK